MKRFLSAVFFVFMFFLVAGKSFAEPVRWEVSSGGNGHLYEAVLTSPISWTEANAAAQARGVGWHLATITSAEESNFVFSLVDDLAYWTVQTSASQGPWLGGFQPPGSPEPSGNWQWVTGEPWGYAYWDTGEPNDGAPGEGENTIHYQVHPPATMGQSWNDASDNITLQRGYVVEFEINRTVLPKTGQTTSYGTGDDGNIQAGEEWPSPRFEDNGDGTITDHLTGLIWLKDANRFGRSSWFDALNACNTLAADGINLTDGSVAGDWRLPNIVELESLANAQAANPSTWLNTQGFTNVQSSVYWSSNTNARHADYAWYMYMDGGYVDSDLVNSVDKSFSSYVWPVRSGQNGPAKTWRTGQTTTYAAGDDGALQAGVTWPTPRFTDNDNGTVTDNLTGLIWLKNADCFGGTTWSAALTNCNNLANGSCGLTDGSVAGDWRLPNREELLSLIDYSRYSPALPPGHSFTNVQPTIYWSSSTDANVTPYAWGVRMYYNGNVSSSVKSGNYYVWPVRGGQVGDPCVNLGGDTDGDGVCDDNDGCPTDPVKIGPGECGCGVPDTDTDGDGTPDCNDLCPNDPNKIDPGVCGCGLNDLDLDQDGTPDCNDDCPNDPNKSLPGVCGCDTPDTDTDGDETPDCNDNCSTDPNKTEPGTCGCGIADIDTDGDTIADCDDNCPSTPNPLQADSDQDGIGDACENNPPNVPSNPSPLDDASGVELINPVLSWTGGDPDPGDVVTYDVYFGRFNPPTLTSSGQTVTSSNLGKLNCFTTYYWKVVAKDNNGNVTSGPVWLFTTTDEGCPVIEGISPNPCNPLNVVTISGRNFGSIKQAIWWGMLKYEKNRIVRWTGTSIDIKILPYNGWLPGTSKTKDVWFKVGPLGNKVKSNRVPLTITKP